MRIKLFVCNYLWMLISFPSYFLFRLGTLFPSYFQKRILKNLLERNKESFFGKSYSFSEIKNHRDFQKAIPLMTYEDYSSYVDRISNGEDGILSEDKILILEPTSGSTSAKKLIPYNKGLKNDFQKGIRPWMFSIFSSRLSVLFGSSYWSISPICNDSLRTRGGLEIGFKNDSEYLGKIEQYFLKIILSVPPEVSIERDIDNYRYLTLFFLLKDKNLSFVSVWNPTFLKILLNSLEGWFDKLVHDIGLGEISHIPNPDNFLSRMIICNKIKPSPKRAEELRRVNRVVLGNELLLSYVDIWPSLKMISCWCDASSKKFAKNIETLFPGVLVQPKGLILTEAIVSIPVSGLYGSPLSIRSHFFEFIGEDESLYLANELELNQIYEVVVSTGGGFYRYRTGDLVKVVDYLGNCPSIEFLGRKGYFSDLFGEKLNERFVQIVLERVFQELGIEYEFAMLAPHKFSNDEYCYVLFIQSKNASEKCKEVSDKTDKALKESFHYNYCRNLGQLGDVKTFFIESDGLETYIETQLKKGKRLGDIKNSSLAKDLDWESKFIGSFIK